MKAIIIAAGFVAMAASPTCADVDTLECNTAVAVRVQYAVAPYLAKDPLAEFYGRRQSGAFCLLLNGETVGFVVDERAFSVHFDPRPRGPDELGEERSALGLIKSIKLTPDDLAGRVFYATPMVRKPYDPATDGNWQYTPMWMAFGDPVRISVGERESGAGA